MPAKNLLRFETSPYLQQHADNPVHWAPWGAEALEEARAHNKPILLSIGYAACHWCHVMAHESFEDDETAALMNQHFVCVKVDREERPDIDDLYMTALSLMGEQGGWPLTMFLDAQGQPFWGGTYFPKSPSHGRPGFAQVLEAVSEAYQQGHAQIATNTQAIMSALQKRSAASAQADGVSPQQPNIAMRSLAGHIDRDNGGFGGAPKFPQPVLFHFLLEQALMDDDENVRMLVLHTLRQICRGGIYDHLAGGFARYTVDAHWLIPHFEKMLYDNALLISLLCLAWQNTREDLFKHRVADTIQWLIDDMRLASGGVAASRDADSETETGESAEGAFYLWSTHALSMALGDRAPEFARAYGCSTDGNFEGQNILNRLQAQNDDETAFKADRKKLLVVRAHRSPPARDDKILADWNGMTISALVHASDMFDRPDWREHAETLFADICRELYQDNGLRHSACAGRVMTLGLGDDYVHMITAALWLYAATGEHRYMQWAKLWVEEFDAAHLVDHAYINSPRHARDVLVHHRPSHDGATPSLNNAALFMLHLFYLLTGEKTFDDKADLLAGQFSGQLSTQYPQMPLFLRASAWRHNSTTLVILAPTLDTDAHRLLRHIAITHMVRGVVLSLAETDSSQLDQQHPAYGKTCVNGQPTAYICPAGRCLAPITDLDELKKTLQKLKI